jgi:hypothetical protein
MNAVPGPGRVELLMALSQGCQDAVGAVINPRYGTGIPELTWRPVTDIGSTIYALVGQVDGALADHDALLVLQAWADRHQLTPVQDPLPGITEFHGHLTAPDPGPHHQDRHGHGGGVPVQIWAVTDRVTFEAPDRTRVTTRPRTRRGRGTAGTR